MGGEGLAEGDEQGAPQDKVRLRQRAAPFIDMLRRIRRAGYRADVNEQLDAEAQAAQQAEAAERQSDATAAMAAAMEELTVSSSHISSSARKTERNAEDELRKSEEANVKKLHAIAKEGIAP